VIKKTLNCSPPPSYIKNFPPAPRRFQPPNQKRGRKRNTYLFPFLKSGKRGTNVFAYRSKLRFILIEDCRFSILFIFDWLLLFGGLLISVAFLTLVERKVLGYSHFRKGPTKILVFGVFQPLRDAAKLFCKEILILRGFDRFFYIIAPLLGLGTMLFLSCLLSFSGELGISFSLLSFLCVLRLGVYFLLFCGWGSNRKFSLVGRYRAISQRISYEVCLSVFLLTVCFSYGRYDVLLDFCDQGGF